VTPDVAPRWVPVEGILSHVWWGHSLFLLPPVAEPDPDHLLLELQAVGQVGDLLRRGLGVLVEVLLQGTLDGHLTSKLKNFFFFVADGRRK